MTEQEWSKGEDPNALLALVRGKASERKLRLFACACWRLLWHLLDEPARRLVEVMERHADEPLAEASELLRACLAANTALGKIKGTSGRMALRLLLETVTTDDPAVRAILATRLLVVSEATESIPPGPPDSVDLSPGLIGTLEVEGRVMEAQCELLRCLFGNPFRPAGIDSAWLRANDGAAPKLARAIYDERTFAQLGVLGDALEDAGCTDAEVLAHCRRPGTHVRGCWVVDAVLGKG